MKPLTNVRSQIAPQEGQLTVLADIDIPPEITSKLGKSKKSLDDNVSCFVVTSLKYLKSKDNKVR